MLLFPLDTAPTIYKSPGFFSGVHYFAIDLQVKDEELLEGNGATKSMDPSKATHVFCSRSPKHPLDMYRGTVWYKNLTDPKWICQCLLAGKVLSATKFHPDDVLSGVSILFRGLDPLVLKLLLPLVKFSGGRHQDKLTMETTHIIFDGPMSIMEQELAALQAQFGADTGIHIVTLEWLMPHSFLIWKPIIYFEIRSSFLEMDDTLVQSEMDDDESSDGPMKQGYYAASSQEEQKETRMDDDEDAASSQEEQKEMQMDDDDDDESSDGRMKQDDDDAASSQEEQKETRMDEDDDAASSQEEQKETRMDEDDDAASSQEEQKETRMDEDDDAASSQEEQKETRMDDDDAASSQEEQKETRMDDDDVDLQAPLPRYSLRKRTQYSFFCKPGTLSEEDLESFSGLTGVKYDAQGEYFIIPGYKPTPSILVAIGKRYTLVDADWVISSNLYEKVLDPLTFVVTNDTTRGARRHQDRGGILKGIKLFLVGFNDHEKKMQEVTEAHGASATCIENSLIDWGDQSLRFPFTYVVLVEGSAQAPPGIAKVSYNDLRDTIVDQVMRGGLERPPT
ncbi:hypothetical protein C8J57DRAFT_1720137 [Mycena rebaudengoi]|nr:hypothetical protein C8J57DRAFT_1720137 [Mycena rebaudengoi]